MFITRIIMAASVESEVFSSTRFVINSLTTPIICEDTIAEIINTAVPNRRDRLPLSKTKPVNARVMLVISRPNRIGSTASGTESFSPVNPTMAVLITL